MKNRKSHTTRLRLSPAQKEAIYALPLCKQFRIVHIDEASGLAVYQHVLVDTDAHDYPQVLAVAKAYARETPCAINPEIKPRAEAARQKIFPGIEGFVNPDLTTEKYGYIDVKSPLNKGNIVSNANDACKQGAIAVITDLRLDEVLKHKRILQVTEKIFSDRNRNHRGKPNYLSDQVHWFVNGKLLKYNRPEEN